MFCGWKAGAVEYQGSAPPNIEGPVDTVAIAGKAKQKVQMQMTAAKVQPHVRQSTTALGFLTAAASIS